MMIFISIIYALAGLIMLTEPLYHTGGAIMLLAAGICVAARHLANAVKGLKGGAV